MTMLFAELIPHELPLIKTMATLRQIEVFRSVPLLLSISGSAQDLGTTAASISTIFQRLDNHFDVPVFQERRHRVSLQKKALRS